MNPNVDDVYQVLLERKMTRSQSHFSRKWLVMHSSYFGTVARAPSLQVLLTLLVNLKDTGQDDLAALTFQKIEQATRDGIAERRLANGL